MVELRTLAYFVTACRCETLGRAAKELGIALSTLSTTLKSLEADIGLALLRRVNGGLYPSEQGRWLLRRAERLLALEAFARRWVAAPRNPRPRILNLEIGLSHTIAGVAGAVQCAIDGLAAQRPDVLVNVTWIDENNSAGPEAPAEAWSGIEPSRVLVGLAGGRALRRRPAVTVLSDRWVFACRVPVGTRKPASAAELAAGRLVIPALAQPLIAQVERYLREQKISSVRFVSDHPGELPRLIDEFPDAALFVPESLVSPRLGLLRVKTFVPDRPLTVKIAARAPISNSLTAQFIRHLRHAFADMIHVRSPQPAISLRQVHYFNMVHRLRRISAASKGANVSQPALSEQLHKLEGALGVPLFRRQSDGVTPTAAGDRFAAVATIIEAGLLRFAGDAAVAAPSGRRITVGILPSVSQHGLLVNRITEAVVAVQGRRPELKLVVREAPNGTLQDWVMRGRVGVAIVETGLPHMPRLPLGSSESLAAIAHASHKLLPRGAVRLADLVRLPLALPTSRFGLRQLIETAAEQRHLKIAPAMEVDALAMLVAILARLPVCTVLPPSAVHRELREGELVAHPITDPAVARQLFVIYSAERSLSEPERDLVNTLRLRLADSQNSEPAAPQGLSSHDNRK